VVHGARKVRERFNKTVVILRIKKSGEGTKGVLGVVGAQGKWKKKRNSTLGGGSYKESAESIGGGRGGIKSR